MPARTVQRVEQITREEWRPLCLECNWWGSATYDTEAECDRAAYEHNRIHHDGAGVEGQIEDLLGALPSRVETHAMYRRFYRQGIGLAIFGFAMVVWLCLTVDNPTWRAFAVGMNLGAALVNAFFAGRWAMRLEQLALEASSGA